MYVMNVKDQVHTEEALVTEKADDLELPSTTGASGCFGSVLETQRQGS